MQTVSINRIYVKRNVLGMQNIVKYNDTYALKGIEMRVMVSSWWTGEFVQERDIQDFKYICNV